MVPMTENERRILSELSRAAPLSKRDVTLRCGMGWATAVKLMTRLEEQGLIAPVGSERQNGAGKTATVYGLSPVKPAAIGIDVEYARARLNIRNLAGDCLFEINQATPPFAAASDLIAFLDGLIARAEAEAVKRGIELAGAGIGVPSHLFGTLGVPYDEAAEALNAAFNTPSAIAFGAATVWGALERSFKPLSSWRYSSHRRVYKQRPASGTGEGLSGIPSCSRWAFSSCSRSSAS